MCPVIHMLYFTRLDSIRQWMKLPISSGFHNLFFTLLCHFIDVIGHLGYFYRQQTGNHHHIKKYSESQFIEMHNVSLFSYNIGIF